MKSEGVVKYVKTTLDVYFPDGHFCCALCPCLETYSRLQCRRTGEYLLDSKGRGFYCPLMLDDEDDANNKIKEDEQ